MDTELVDRVRSRLLADSGGDPLAARAVAAAVRAEGRTLDDRAVLALVDALREELVGAGPLAALLEDPNVTDVLVNAPDQIWLDRGRGLEPAGLILPDEAAVRRLAQRMAAAAGRRLDDAAPWCDVRLPSGVRLHAILPPIARAGTTLSFRVPARRAWTLEELGTAGALGPIGTSVLRAVVEARVSFLVSGGTGTGKTTLLSTLLGLAASRERLILVEDLPELRPEHPHVVGLSARPPNVEGAGAVSLRDLVRQALRMRPDRLVVGECRGAEVVDLLSAMNTGHDGGCGTVHTNSPEDLPARLEALAVAAGLTRAGLHSQLASAVDVVLHLGHGELGQRVLQQVAVLIRDQEGWVQSMPALVRESGDLRPADGAELLQSLLGHRLRG